MSVCQPRLGGNVIFSVPNWDIAIIFFVQIPLLNEHLFCKYFVRLSVGNATKCFATYGCFHPCFKMIHLFQRKKQISIKIIIFPFTIIEANIFYIFSIHNKYAYKYNDINMMFLVSNFGLNHFYNVTSNNVNESFSSFLEDLFCRNCSNSF